MCTRTQDRQGTPDRSASKTALAKVPCSGLRNVVDYRRSMVGSVPPIRRHHSHVHLPHRLVPHTRPPCRQDVQHTSVERQWHLQQIDGTKHLPRGAQRQSGGHSGVQAHGTIEKSQHPKLHHSTLIANSFNRQLTISKLGKLSSSRRTRQVSKNVKRMSLEEVESFTSEQVTSAIKSCRNSRAYSPDSLSIFHLKNLGPLATEHLTTLYSDSLKSCRLPSTHLLPSTNEFL